MISRTDRAQHVWLARSAVEERAQIWTLTFGKESWISLGREAKVEIFLRDVIESIICLASQ